MASEIDLTDQKAVLAEVKARVEYFYGQAGGTIRFPNSAVGDIVRLAYRAALLAKDETD